jgi:nicotinamide mononucleotide transporter
VATTEILTALVAAWRTTSRLEIAGAAAGFVYVTLAIRERRSCWIAGAVSTALYIVVFAQARLYLQGGLQCAYLVLSAYGWWAWRSGASGRSPAVRHASPALQSALLMAVLAATAVTAPMLGAATDAASPWLDAATTWGSIAATWLLARKFVDNWLWWIVIDLGIGALAIAQRLWLTALLYLAFAVLAVAGFARWRRGAGVPA